MLERHRARVSDLDWSPDGTTLLSVGQDGIACLWRAADGTMVRALRNGSGPLCCCCFHPTNPNLLLLGTAAGELLALNASTGALGRTCCGLILPENGLWLASSMLLVGKPSTRCRCGCLCTAKQDGSACWGLPGYCAGHVVARTELQAAPMSGVGACCLESAGEGRFLLADNRGCLHLFASPLHAGQLHALEQLAWFPAPRGRYHEPACLQYLPYCQLAGGPAALLVLSSGEVVLSRLLDKVRS